MAITTNTTPNATQDTLALIGRILVAYLFIPAGIGKLMGFGGTVGYITSASLPLPEVAAAIAILIELGLGIALLLGFKTRWTAIVMAIFSVVTALFFQDGGIAGGIWNITVLAMVGTLAEQMLDRVVGLRRTWSAEFPRSSSRSAGSQWALEIQSPCSVSLPPWS